MALALRYAALSDVGLLRRDNQDSAYAGPRLLVVADGMGGHAGGDVASSVAVATLAPLDDDPPGAELLERLRRAVSTANTSLARMVTEQPRLEGMGTTVTALLRAGNRLGLAHVGDSRCYLLRDGTLEQVTRDHTFVQALVDDGRITPEEADRHPQRSMLLRALDGRGEVELDLSVREIRVGDRYLVCSDGLSGVVSFDTLAEALSRGGSPEDTVEELVALALRGGGPDNVTAVVADVVDVDAAPNDVPTVVGAAASEQRMRTVGTSAADRAAALGRPQPSTTPAALDSARGSDRPRRWLRLGVPLVAVVAVLVASAWGAWAWVGSQYYVGSDGSRVAIFSGIDQTLGPVSLGRVYEDQELPLVTLTSYSRRAVVSSIPVDDLVEARQVVEQLRLDALLCAPAEDDAGAAGATATTPAADPAVPAATVDPAAPVVPAAPVTPTPTPTPTATTSPLGCGTAPGSGS